MDQRESNKKLIELIQQGVDTEENYLQLYNQNHGFIYQVIKKRVHGIYEIDDLMQSAFLALVKAVECFDTTRPLEESNFLQLLKFCIWNELRDKDLPALMVVKVIKYNKTFDKLYTSLNRKPTDYEIALEMEIELSELDSIKAARRFRYKLSLDEPIGEDGDTTRLELIADSQVDDVDFNSDLEKLNLNRLLQEALSKLPEKSQDVINKRYFNNWTLEKCGQELNVTRERVRQVESKALRILRRDYILKRQLHGYVSDYENVGVNQFNSTRISSVERIVMERERRLQEWKNQRYKEMLQGIEGFENIF